MKNLIVNLDNIQIKFTGDIREKFSSKHTNGFEVNTNAYERIKIKEVQTLIGIEEYESV